MKLADGWYVAELSSEISQRPIVITLFGRSLVARRDARGQVLLMDTGQQLPTAERYGYVWAWYGTSLPTHPLPSFPLAEDPSYLSFRLQMPTSADPLRILESQYDADHYLTVHKVRASSISVVSSENEPLLDPSETIFKARIEAPLAAPASISGRLLEALGIRMPRTFSVTADTFTSGCVTLTRLGDGMAVWVLLGMSPVAADRTIVHELVLLERTGNSLRDALRQLGWKLIIKSSNRQDRAVLNQAQNELGDPYDTDEAILDFRRCYNAAGNGNRVAR